MDTERGCWDRLVDYLKCSIRCECGTTTATDYSYPDQIVLSKENLLHITGSQDISEEFDVEQYAQKAGYRVENISDGRSYRFIRTP